MCSRDRGQSYPTDWVCNVLELGARAASPAVTGIRDDVDVREAVLAVDVNRSDCMLCPASIDSDVPYHGQCSAVGALRALGRLTDGGI